MSSVGRLHVGLRAVRVAALLAVLLVVSLGLASFSLATFSDVDTTTATFATDTLAAPTSPSASGGASVTVSWTATVRTYATGYHVYRATALAGPYGLVGTVTPRTTTTYTETPAVGTYFYKIRAYYQSWESIDAGPVSATVSAPLSTGYKACTSNLADPGAGVAGDGNGYELNAGNACLNVLTYATDSNSGTGGTQSCGAGAVPAATKDRHRFWGYVFGLPGAISAVNGIQVQADLGMNNTTGTTNVCAQLSWDGGTTWTTMKTQAIVVAARTTYTFGTTSDTWGRAWALGDLSAANFRVRLIDASTLTTKQFRLYYVAVQVTYVP